MQTPIEIGKLARQMSNTCGFLVDIATPIVDRNVPLRFAMFASQARDSAEMIVGAIWKKIRFLPNSQCPVLSWYFYEA